MRSLLFQGRKLLRAVPPQFLEADLRTAFVRARDAFYPDTPRCLHAGLTVWLSPPQTRSRSVVSVTPSDHRVNCDYRALGSGGQAWKARGIKNAPRLGADEQKDSTVCVIRQAQSLETRTKVCISLSQSHSIERTDSHEYLEFACATNLKICTVLSSKFSQTRGMNKVALEDSVPNAIIRATE
jgi:hypothetical protein